MKRWIIGALFFLILIVSVIYVIIPSTYNILLSVPVQARYNAASKVISNKTYWQYWWPGICLSDSMYEYKELKFTTGRTQINSASVEIERNEDKVVGTIAAVFIERDSTSIVFQSKVPLSSNPVARALLFIKARSIEQDINEFMLAIQQKFSNTRALYGIDITKQRVTDSSLIALRKSFTGLPNTGDIYQMVQSLEGYIFQQGGKVVNPPMLNIYTEDSIHFDAMVALPVDKDLPAKVPYMLKKMVLGNILVAEVTGDVNVINRAQQELNNYVQDLQKVAPAIPYQSLVTNRLKQPDSSKWVTRLYYPVFD